MSLSYGSTSGILRERIMTGYPTNPYRLLSRPTTLCLMSADFRGMTAIPFAWRSYGLRSWPCCSPIGDRWPRCSGVARTPLRWWIPRRPIMFEFLRAPPVQTLLRPPLLSTPRLRGIHLLHPCLHLRSGAKVRYIFRSRIISLSCLPVSCLLPRR